MKVLFVSALLPYPPYQGGQVRIYNLLKRIAKNHDITLLSFIRSEEEVEHIKHLNFCREVIPVMRGSAWQMKYVLKAAFSANPLLYATYTNEEMRRMITKELSTARYDLIHLEPSYVWPSLPQTDVPTVVAEHNIESSIYSGFVGRFNLVFLRPILFLDVMKLWFGERQIWKKANHIISVSEQDASIIRRVSPHISVVANGVDLETYSFKPKTKKNGLTILFVGYFGWLQNRDALSYLLDDLWPKINDKFNNAKLRVIGRGLSKKLEDKVDGTYLAEVDDLVSEYHKADLLLAPIRIGGGTRYKILEAMACGTPVVTTTKGAQGLGVKNGKELLIADSPEETVEAITKIKREMLINARKLVEEKYSWDKLAQKLEGVWKYVAKKSG